MPSVAVSRESWPSLSSEVCSGVPMGVPAGVVWGQAPPDPYVKGSLGPGGLPRV